MSDKLIAQLNQKIQKLNDLVKNLNDRITVLEQTIQKPLYEYRGSLYTSGKSGSLFSVNTVVRGVGSFIARYSLLMISALCGGTAFYFLYSYGPDSPLVHYTILALLAGLALFANILFFYFPKFQTYWVFLLGLAASCGAWYFLFCAYHLIDSYLALSISLLLFGFALYVSLLKNYQIMSLAATVVAFAMPFACFKMMHPFYVGCYAVCCAVLVKVLQSVIPLKNKIGNALVNSIAFIGLVAMYERFLYGVPHAGWLFLGALMVLYCITPYIQSMYRHKNLTLLEGIIFVLAAVYSAVLIYCVLLPQGAGVITPLRLIMQASVSSVGLFYLVFGCAIGIMLIGALVGYYSDNDDELLFASLLTAGSGLVGLGSFFIVPMYLQSISAFACASILLLVGVCFKNRYIRAVSYIEYLVGLALLCNVHRLFLLHQYSWPQVIVCVASLLIWTILFYIVLARYQQQFLQAEKHFAPLFQLVALIVPGYLLFWQATQQFYFIIGLQWYACIIALIGIIYFQSLMRWTAYWLYGVSIVYPLILFKLQAISIVPAYSFMLNMFFLSTVFSTLIVRYSIAHYKKRIPSSEYLLLVRIMNALISLAVFLWGIVVLILKFDQPAQAAPFFLRAFREASKSAPLVRNYRTDLLLGIYYACASSLFFFIGTYFRQKAVRYVGAFSLFLLLNKIVTIALDVQNLTGTIITFLCVAGILFVGWVFYYRRSVKK